MSSAKAAGAGAGAGSGGPFTLPSRRQHHQHQHQHQRVLARRVDRYDGQAIYCGGRARFELGNYLGGGAAGVV